MWRLPPATLQGPGVALPHDSAERSAAGSRGRRGCSKAGPAATTPLRRPRASPRRKEAAARGEISVSALSAASAAAMATAMETWSWKGKAVPQAKAPRKIPATAPRRVLVSSSGSPWAHMTARLATSAMDAIPARAPAPPAASELTAPAAAWKGPWRAGGPRRPKPPPAWTRTPRSPRQHLHFGERPRSAPRRRDPKAGAPGRASELAPRSPPPQGAKCTLSSDRPRFFDALGKRALSVKLLGAVWRAPPPFLPSQASGELPTCPRIHPRFGHPRPALRRKTAAVVHRESATGMRQER